MIHSGIDSVRALCHREDKFGLEVEKRVTGPELRKPLPHQPDIWGKLQTPQAELNLTDLGDRDTGARVPQYSAKTSNAGVPLVSRLPWAQVTAGETTAITVSRQNGPIRVAGTNPPASPPQTESLAVESANRTPKDGIVKPGCGRPHPGDLTISDLEASSEIDIRRECWRTMSSDLAQSRSAVKPGPEVT
jgi:hypothetical protein